MSTPLLVRTYDSATLSPSSIPVRPPRMQALPPIASFTFAEILRSADSPDFQAAIDGIAEICAKNHMSLADQYASHLPPQGEITATSSSTTRQHPGRPEMKRPLTTVPEASSSGSEGSRRSKKRKGSFFLFRPPRDEPLRPPRTLRIGSMGRTIPLKTTTALTNRDSLLEDFPTAQRRKTPPNSVEQRRSNHETGAVASLSSILAHSRDRG